MNEEFESECDDLCGNVCAFWLIIDQTWTDEQVAALSDYADSYEETR